LIGGSLGTALFGAIFASRLGAHVAAALATGTVLPPTSTISPQSIARLAPDARAVYIEAFTASHNVVFLVAAAITLIAFVLTWFVPEHALRDTIAVVAQDVGRETGDLFPMPTDACAEVRMERSLSLLAERDARRGDGSVDGV
jgi:hypothetical protein